LGKGLPAGTANMRYACYENRPGADRASGLVHEQAYHDRRCSAREPNQHPTHLPGLPDAPWDRFNRTMRR